MKNIIDSIIINGVKYNRVEAKTKYTCDECDLEKICSNNSDFSCMCAYACESGYVWKTDNKLIKQLTMEEPKELLIGFSKDSDGNWVLNTHKDYEIKEVDGKFKLIRKQPQYPKNYTECCGVLKIPNDERYIDIDIPYVSNYNKLLSALAQLLICRNAYWKVAGEQMGLCKPWEPTTETVYCISRSINILKCSYRGGKSNILEFPTEEMRDVTL